MYVPVNVCEHVCVCLHVAGFLYLQICESLCAVCAWLPMAICICACMCKCTCMWCVRTFVCECVGGICVCLGICISVCELIFVSVCACLSVYA